MAGLFPWSVFILSQKSCGSDPQLGLTRGVTGQLCALGSISVCSSGSYYAAAGGGTANCQLEWQVFLAFPHTHKTAPRTGTMVFVPLSYTTDSNMNSVSNNHINKDNFLLWMEGIRSISSSITLHKIKKKKRKEGQEAKFGLDQGLAVYSPEDIGSGQRAGGLCPCYCKARHRRDLHTGVMLQVGSGKVCVLVLSHGQTLQGLCMLAWPGSGEQLWEEARLACMGPKPASSGQWLWYLANHCPVVNFGWKKKIPHDYTAMWSCSPTQTQSLM